MSILAALAVQADATAGQCKRYVLETGTVNCFVPAAFGRAIAENGDVAGEYSCLGSHPKHFTWPSGGVVTTMPIPQGIDWVAVYGVNSRGTMVGATEPLNNSTRTAFRTLSGVITSLPNIQGANTSEALAINESGTICGYSQNSATGNPPLTAVKWDKGIVNILALPVGPYGVANDISDNGQICGWMGPSSGRRAFVWTEGAGTEIGSVGDSLGLEAEAINNLGEIVGVRFVMNPNGAGTLTRSWIWRKGVMTDLGVLPTWNRTEVRDINDLGQAVGISGGNPQVGQPEPAFIWEDGVMMSLGDLEIVNKTASIVFGSAQAINNAGQITGVATLHNVGQVAYRLTPVPPLMGDTNCDWVVNIDDLTDVILNWGEEVEARPFEGSADVNEDGVVDGGDLVDVINGWTTESGK